MFDKCDIHVHHIRPVQQTPGGSADGVPNEGPIGPASESQNASEAVPVATGENGGSNENLAGPLPNPRSRGCRLTAFSFGSFSPDDGSQIVDQTAAGAATVEPGRQLGFEVGEIVTEDDIDLAFDE